MSEPMSNCSYCRSVFRTSDIQEWIDGGRTPVCPNCGIDAVTAGEATPEELERAHLAGFGALTLVLDSLRSAGIRPEGIGPGLLCSRQLPTPSHGSVALIVGRREMELLVEPPRESGDTWTVDLIGVAGTPVPVPRRLAAASAREVGSIIAELERKPDPCFESG
jgi:hypothetical protein